MVKKILTYNRSPRILRKKALKVEKGDHSIFENLIPNMIDTLIHSGGLGLAANQVGEAKRIIVIDATDVSDSGIIVMINPEITFASPELIETQGEGCLSLPNVTRIVKRHYRIRVKYKDENWKERRVSAVGLLAVIIQHEIDHLNGKLIIDYD